MKKYDYLIVGGGMAADAAVRGIRELDGEGTVGILTQEQVPPYERPPLSKGLWTEKMGDNDIDCGTEKLGVDIITGCRATKLDTKTKTVDAGGTPYGYGKLLLATGVRPRELPFSEERVIYYRSFADYRTLAALMAEKEHFAVVGGGFIGCEMAAALAGKGNRVTMVFPEDAPGGGRFPRELAHELADYYRSRGVELMPGLKLSGMECDDAHCYLSLENGLSFTVEGVVVGAGAVPNDELAEEAGLEVDNGIVVDGQLSTTGPSIYAAGDVARFHNPQLGQALRVEHEDNALTMGRMAGRNMAGAEEEYTHLPFFYSDMFEVGYEAVGILDASAGRVVGSWNGLHEKSVHAYVKDGRVCGVLLWNLFGQVEAARKLVGTPGAENEIDLLQAKLDQLLDTAAAE